MNLGALRSAGYRRFFLGNVFSLNGVWLSRITLAWIAWEMTGRAGFVGLVAFLVFSPTLFAGPFFGVLTDRRPLLRTAVLAHGALAACAVALLLASLLGALTPAILCGLALATGLVNAALNPVRLVLAPSLVPREVIGSAIALGSINFNAARLVGPAAGGIVIAEWGVESALALAAACFLPMIALLPGLNPRPSPPLARDTGLLAALGDGIAHAARTPLIRRAMLLIGLFSLAGRGLLEILPVLADGVFGRGAAGLGALTASAGAGALVAAALIALGPGQRPGRFPLSSRIAAPAGFLLVLAIAWTPSWPLALGLVAALALCGTLTGVGMQSTVQLLVPDAYRARVMSLWTVLAIGGSAIGAIALGALIDLAGHRAALTGTALAGLGLMVPLVLPLAAPARADTCPKAPAAPPKAPPLPGSGDDL